MSQFRVTRKQSDLFIALKKHLELLRQYYHLAFQENDSKYYGEIAGKLRLLVYDKGQKGLLTSLLKETGVIIPIKIDGPPMIRTKSDQIIGGDEVTLDKYLNSLAYIIRTPHGLKSVLVIDLIRMWSQQDGAAHEDWQHDEEYAAFKEFGVFVGGTHIPILQLRITTGIVLSTAEKFIEKFQQ